MCVSSHMAKGFSKGILSGGITQSNLLFNANTTAKIVVTNDLQCTKTLLSLVSLLERAESGPRATGTKHPRLA